MLKKVNTKTHYINEDEITFLICGRVDEYTINSFNSIKKYHKKSKIIISTWKSDYEKACSVKRNDKTTLIVTSDDPGSGFRKENTYHNVNRVIVASQAGLKVVNTKWVFRIRSDISFTKNILYSKYIAKEILTKNSKPRIIVSSTTSIDSSRGYPMPYHICDWFHFGLTEMVRESFDISLMPTEYENWYINHPKPENKIDKGNYSRYMVEDWITSNYVKKKYAIEHQCYYNEDFKEIDRWMKILPELYYVIQNEYVFLVNEKYKRIRFFHSWAMISRRKMELLDGIQLGIISIAVDRISFLIKKNIFKIWQLFWYIKKKMRNL